jgi:hypothetical protein
MNTTVNWQIVRHTVSIAGVVKDRETQSTIADANVEIINLKKQTRTGIDGWFHFIDLPSNTYNLVASLPDARARYGIVSLQSIASPNLNVEILLPPTAIKGVVKGLVTHGGLDGPHDGIAIAGAKVQIEETGDRVWTDQQGQFLFTRLEAQVSPLNLTISAQEYVKFQTQVTILEFCTWLRTIHHDLAQE